jgi:hypothetical protein
MPSSYRTDPQRLSQIGVSGYDPGPNVHDHTRIEVHGVDQRDEGLFVVLCAFASPLRARLISGTSRSREQDRGTQAVDSGSSKERQLVERGKSIRRWPANDALMRLLNHVRLTCGTGWVTVGQA